MCLPMLMMVKGGTWRLPGLVATVVVVSPGFHLFARVSGGFPSFRHVVESHIAAVPADIVADVFGLLATGVGIGVVAACVPQTKIAVWVLASG